MEINFDYLALPSAVAGGLSIVALSYFYNDYYV